MQSHRSFARSDLGASQFHAPPQDFTATQSTSGASGANVSSNEERINISDMAERRRMGNRIAQQSYSRLPCSQITVAGSQSEVYNANVDNREETKGSPRRS